MWYAFVCVDQPLSLWTCLHTRTTMHYSDVIMGAMSSQITSLSIVYSTVYSGADQRKHQSSASLAFVWGIHRWPANSPHNWPVTRKMFPLDDVIMAGNRPVMGVIGTGRSLLEDKCRLNGLFYRWMLGMQASKPAAGHAGKWKRLQTPAVQATRKSRDGFC